MSKRSDGREDGRLETTAGFVQHLLREPPRLAFQPGWSRAEFEEWQGRVRRKLRQVLAFPKVAPQPAPKLIHEARREGYRLQKWELYPEPASVVPFLMLVPDGVSAARPAPTVMCFPGSEQPKESLCGEPWEGGWKNKFGEHNLMALHFVRAGYVAVAFDNPGTAALFDPERSDWRRQSAHLIWLGRTYEGLSTFQKMAGLKWLRTLPFVDRQRIAVCGHSLGAKPALLMGVLDTRLAAVVWNDQASDWRERIVTLNMKPVAPWHYIPGFIRWFDYIDLMCALAPRPLLITEGGHLKDHARIRRAYALCAAARQVKVSFMPNFADPSRRSRRKTPEGIDAATYATYANYDGDHYFKDEVAAPWLAKVFRRSAQ